MMKDELATSSSPAALVGLKKMQIFRSPTGNPSCIFYTNKNCNGPSDKKWISVLTRAQMKSEEQGSDYE